MSIAQSSESDLSKFNNYSKKIFSRFVKSFTGHFSYISSSNFDLPDAYFFHFPYMIYALCFANAILGNEIPW